MPTCPKCQTENPQAAKFCRNCGYQFPVQPPQSESPPKEPFLRESPQETGSEVTSLGLSQNTAGVLCYLLGPVTGIIFLLLENKNKFVRFHALQSTILFGGLLVLKYTLNFLPFTFWQFKSPISTILNMAGVIFWVVLMVKTYQGKRYQLPIVGETARKQSEGI